MPPWLPEEGELNLQTSCGCPRTRLRVFRLGGPGRPRGRSRRLAGQAEVCRGLAAR